MSLTGDANLDRSSLFTLTLILTVFDVSLILLTHIIPNTVEPIKNIKDVPNPGEPKKDSEKQIPEILCYPLRLSSQKI